MQRSTVLLLLCTMPVSADNFFETRLCFILDGFLGFYGLFITAMFVREKFFMPKAAPDENLYSSLRGQDVAGYDRLRFDAERGVQGSRGRDDSLYTGLTHRGEDSEYRELPRRERQRKNEQVYQGLSAATRDTYDTLQQR